MRSLMFIIVVALISISTIADQSTIEVRVRAYRLGYMHAVIDSRVKKFRLSERTKEYKEMLIKYETK